MFIIIISIANFLLVVSNLIEFVSEFVSHQHLYFIDKIGQVLNPVPCITLALQGRYPSMLFYRSSFFLLFRQQALQDVFMSSPLQLIKWAFIIPDELALSVFLIHGRPKVMMGVSLIAPSFLFSMEVFHQQLAIHYHNFFFFFSENREICNKILLDVIVWHICFFIFIQEPVTF